MSLDYELTLASNLLNLSRLFESRLHRLFLDDLRWDKVASNRVGREGWVDLDLLELTKDWLLWVFFEKEFDLRGAEAHHCRSEQFL